MHDLRAPRLGQLPGNLGAEPTIGRVKAKAQSRTVMGGAVGALAEGSFWRGL